jgi:hypothetical protein
MTESRLFLSSCSRRQLARRRPGRGALAARAVVMMLALAIASGAFLAGYGGL